MKDTKIEEIANWYFVYLFFIPRPAPPLFGEKLWNQSLELVEALGVHEPGLVAVGAVADHLLHPAPVHDLRLQTGNFFCNENIETLVLL